MKIIDKGVLVFVCDEYVNIFMKEHRCIDYRDVCIILLKKKLAQGWGKYASKCNVFKLRQHVYVATKSSSFSS